MTGWLYIIPYITTAHFFNSGKNSRNIIVLFYIPLAQTVEDNAAKTGLMASQRDGQKKTWWPIFCLQKIEEKWK